MSVLGDVHRKASQEQIPLTVHFDLTYRCHQRCVHCYLPEAWRQGERAERELDTRQVTGILDQLADAGTFFLTLSGGEVFLRPDLLEIVAYARQKLFVVSLMTSGAWMVEADLVRPFRELGVLGIYVSLYSMDETVHDGITRTPGSWAAAMRTLETCRTLELPVALNCMVMGPNYHGIMELCEFASRERLPLRWSPELGPRWDGRAHPPGLGLDSEQKALLDRELLDTAIIEKTRENLGHSPDFDRIGCAAGYGFGYITPQGEVWPCLDVNWKCGSLAGPEDFRCLWRDSAALREVRRIQQSLDASKERLCDIYQDYMESGA
jgi:AdoMet-dependent heme synthase